MTRGKHGAQAGRRRATQAEAELARWRDEAARWKRLAHQYIATAQRVPALERAIARAKGTATVPEPEHEREMADLEASWSERWIDAMVAVRDVMDSLIGTLEHLPGEEVPYINAHLLDAMARLPEEVVRDATRDYWPREQFRVFVDRGYANKVAGIMGAATRAAALGGGYTNGRIVSDDAAFQHRLERVLERKGLAPYNHGPRAVSDG